MSNDPDRDAALTNWVWSADVKEVVERIQKAETGLHKAKTEANGEELRHKNARALKHARDAKSSLEEGINEIMGNMPVIVSERLYQALEDMKLTIEELK